MESSRHHRTRHSYNIVRRRRVAVAASPRPRVKLQKATPDSGTMQYLNQNLIPFASLMYTQLPDNFIPENSATFLTYFISTAVYWRAVGKMKQMPDHDASDSSKDKYGFRILSQVALVSEIVSPSSLISIIFKKQLPPYLFWMVLGVGLAWLLFYSAYIFRMRIYNTISQICGFWIRDGESTKERAVDENAPEPTAKLDRVAIKIEELAQYKW